MYTTLKYFCIYVINHILIFTYGYLEFFFQVNFFRQESEQFWHIVFDDVY